MELRNCLGTSLENIDVVILITHSSTRSKACKLHVFCLVEGRTYDPELSAR